MRQAEIILVGDDLERVSPALLSSLEARGLRVLKAQSEAELAALLPEHPQVTIVAYEPSQSDTARRILEVVAHTERKIPVVVVAERGSLDEYYELMSEGAYDYFDLRDGTEPIERSVAWAAGTRAA
jgi:DNA-binding NtrC family response regulator